MQSVCSQALGATSNLAQTHKHLNLAVLQSPGFDFPEFAETKKSIRMFSGTYMVVHFHRNEVRLRDKVLQTEEIKVLSYS